MTDVVIVSAVRTAVGKFGGSLAKIAAQLMLGRKLRELGITVPILGGDGWDSPELTKGEEAQFNNTRSVLVDLGLAKDRP